METFWNTFSTVCHWIVRWKAYNFFVILSLEVLEQTLINLTAIEIFEYLLLQLNKLSNFSCNIDYMELCSATLAHGRLSCLRLLLKLELPLQLLNISLRYFLVYPELHRN